MRHPPEQRRTIGLGAAIIAAVAVLAALVVLGWNVVFLGTPKLPPAAELWTLNRAPAVQFVDARGETLAVRGHLYGPIVRSGDLPSYVGQAFIAAEDQRFMQHSGVDVQSILRAGLANLTAGSTVQGGSTLTQQLVKNLLVGDEQTLMRKVQEARLAIEMEARLSKREILDLYLNRVYLGANAYGVEAAALVYFNKTAADLTLPEAAFLGALPKAPSRYAKAKTAPATTARIHYVLDRMVANGFITSAAANAAKVEPLSFFDDEARRPVSGYVLDAAMTEARRLVPVLPPDAVIALTVDGNLQRRAERALDATLAQRGLGASQGAVVVLDRQGGIRALVGGRDYQASQFNRATHALRQPGSAFKTFVYAAALEQGFLPTTVRNDAPVQIGTWEPANYNDQYLGEITLAKAMAASSNSVAAQLGSEVGPEAVASIARRFGIASPLHAYPSIALGADNVTLLEMTAAYGVIANQGRKSDTRLISEIRDQSGQVLYAAPETSGEPVYGEDAAATLTGMLFNVVEAGTGAEARVPGWEIAGKTGTSQLWRDAWFVGYSAQLTCGVWIGNDDDRATNKATGGGAAASLFAKVMATAHRRLDPEPLRRAENASSWLAAPEPPPATDDTTGAVDEANRLEEQRGAPVMLAPAPAPASSRETVFLRTAVGEDSACRRGRYQHGYEC